MGQDSASQEPKEAALLTHFLPRHSGPLLVPAFPSHLAAREPACVSPAAGPRP